tara:strand:- start:791 stop:1288 length:498 start_codon:yes stop_codon:yes gene_type:complete
MGPIKKLISNRIYLLGIFIVFDGCQSNNFNVNNPSVGRWVSKSPYCEVWFQNWGTYTRLLLVIDADTSIIEPNQYSTEKKNKSYLSPKPYSLIKKQQMKGNIIWEDVINWKNGNDIKFVWEVDRANPKIKLPQEFKGTIMHYNDSLRLKIFNNGENFITLALKSL